MPDSSPLSFLRGGSSRGSSTAAAFLHYAEPRRQRVNAALDEVLRADGRRPALLFDAMRYAVLGEGKRLRPVLCITAAEICGGDMEQVLPTACALELVHAFSLVHDDLPSMDDDAVRRGRASCHVRFGEATAILAGDALFNRAFELMGEQRRISGAARAMDALAVITHAIGADGMAAGQVEDILAEGKEGDLDTLEFIHTRKSASLIRASLEAGAILAGGTARDVAWLGSYGWAIGHAFQIVDDILGETSDLPSLGKPVKTDEARGKLTYPRLLGLEASQAVAEERLAAALDAIEAFGEQAHPLRWIAAYVLDRAR